jgi:hypothetical protein
MPHSAPKTRKSTRRIEPVKPKQIDSVHSLHAHIEDRVRERAYHLWESEGRPQGREFEHWQRAQAEIQRERGESV